MIALYVLSALVIGLGLGYAMVPVAGGLLAAAGLVLARFGRDRTPAEAAACPGA